MICLKSKIKVLDIKNFVIKLRQKLCLDKTEFIKVLRQNFVLSFVLILRPLLGNLKSFLKYSIACIYILPFVMPAQNILWGSILPIKVIYVHCNRNLHHSVSYKFTHLPPCSKNIVIEMAASESKTKITIFT